MTCEEFEELAGAYVLGALPEDEMIEANTHLRSCDLHAELPELALVASRLAVMAPEMEPPVGLKSRLMAAVNADLAAEQRRAQAELPTGPSFLDNVRSWLARPQLGYGLAGAMAVLVAALVVWNMSIETGVDSGTPTSVVTLSGAASGNVAYYAADEVAIMDVEGLAPPPSGHVYQVWAISNGQSTSLGTLEVGEGGVAQAAMTGISLSGVDSIAITIEQEPGAEQPTADPIITGRV